MSEINKADLDRYITGNYGEDQFKESRYATMNESELTFKEFRDKNVDRCNEVFHNLNEWSVSDWAVAVTGEWGEACNIIKKIKRLETADKHLDTYEYRELLRLELARELADTRTYIDLLEAKLHIDPVFTLVEKFNEVSEKRGSMIRF